LNDSQIQIKEAITLDRHAFEESRKKEYLKFVQELKSTL
jgi:hypothetical protein